jgi:hypothetical protein
LTSPRNSGFDTILSAPMGLDPANPESVPASQPQDLA